jgi:hypothetical protein
VQAPGQVLRGFFIYFWVGPQFMNKQWSAVSFIYHVLVTKKWDSKGWYNNQHWNGERVGNESVMVVASAKMLPGICNRQIQYHSFCGGFRKWRYPQMDGL